MSSANERQKLRNNVPKQQRKETNKIETVCRFVNIEYNRDDNVAKLLKINKRRTYIKEELGNKRKYSLMLNPHRHSVLMTDYMKTQKKILTCCQHSD